MRNLLAGSWIALCALAVSCGDRSSQSRTAGASDSDSVASDSVAGDADSVATQNVAELDSTARTLVAFLRGQARFDDIRLADTVVFYVSPEGGGARRRYTRAQLRDPANWKVAVAGFTATLAPPREHTILTTKPGRHLKCLEYSLASIYPELAPLPHVGVTTRREPAGSCLATHNVTFVFDSAARPLTLVAVVYDQWEW